MSGNRTTNGPSLARRARASLASANRSISGGGPTERIGVVPERADHDAAGFRVRREVWRAPRVEAVERRAVFDRPVLDARGGPARDERTETSVSVVARRWKIRAC
jgi:hypothetical protein